MRGFHQADGDEPLHQLAHAPGEIGIARKIEPRSEPTGQAGHDKPEWLGYMPPLSLALEQLNVLYLLGSVHYRPLGDYRSNDFPYLEWFRDPAIIGKEGPLARFQATLRGVDERIVTRNAERQYPYPYLQPSLIPTSVNI